MGKIQIHCFQWQLLYFDSHFSGVCRIGLNLQYIIIRSVNGRAPNERQTITWTDGNRYHLCHNVILQQWWAKALSALHVCSALRAFARLRYNIIEHHGYLKLLDATWSIDLHAQTIPWRFHTAHKSWRIKANNILNPIPAMISVVTEKMIQGLTTPDFLSKFT